jgi:hypothetical protein
VSEGPPDNNVVNLALVRSQGREPDVRLVLELWKLDDGTVRYHASVEEWVPAGGSRASSGWIRDNLRWAILCYAKRWAMGLWWWRRGRRRRP